MSRSRWSQLVLLLAPALLGAQCSVFGIGGANAGDLDGARRRWRAAGIEDYTLVLQRSCFCGGIEPVRIEVRDGAAVSYTVVPTGEPLEAESRRWYPIVEGLFDFLEEAEDRNAHQIDVEYHDQRGYPVTIFVDYEKNTADEEMGYEVKSLVPVGG